MRTCYTGEVCRSHLGQTVTLFGWVNRRRDQGGVIFIDIRDREGVTQAVFRTEENADAAKLSHTLRGEDVVQITGIVSDRPEIDGQSTVSGDSDWYLRVWTSPDEQTCMEEWSVLMGLDEPEEPEGDDSECAANGGTPPNR